MALAIAGQQKDQDQENNKHHVIAKEAVKNAAEAAAATHPYYLPSAVYK